eukprot:CAMPEP_0197257680 /NCGR_PEP_ID=MMETSP1429-20130617/79584_1 /TAXON_ID=49237 /ORGANISM="Chaetoceros  sp., Strain UNC1202" /LENGTH=79 /DNA_ID=CAMNT_0042721591 /DNA_START=11 /DNA_END=247 /DNA_ORIENTATION=+
MIGLISRTSLRNSRFLSKTKPNHVVRTAASPLSTSTDDSTSSSSTTEDAENKKNPSLYYWGTSQSGSIPSRDILEQGRS